MNIVLEICIQKREIVQIMDACVRTHREQRDLKYFFGETGEFQVVLDRRLYQDDNRGLGQGVTDNKVTPANFRLVVERFKSPHEPVSIKSYWYFRIKFPFGKRVLLWLVLHLSTQRVSNCYFSNKTTTTTKIVRPLAKM